MACPRSHSQNGKARAGIRFSRPALMPVSRVAVARPGPSSPCSLGIALPCQGRICPPLFSEAYSVPISSGSLKLLFSAISLHGFLPFLWNWPPLLTLIPTPLDLHVLIFPRTCLSWLSLLWLPKAADSCSAHQPHQSRQARCPLSPMVSVMDAGSRKSGTQCQAHCFELWQLKGLLRYRRLPRQRELPRGCVRGHPDP